MVQILGGLITYLLLAIYCQQDYDDKVDINRVCELGAQIRNEARMDEQAEHIVSQQQFVRDYSAAKT